MMEQNKLQKILENNFPDAQIKLIDLVGDQNHYSLSIEDSVFKGKSMVAQHKIVNSVLREYLDSGELHALQLKTIAKN
tara:strand:- start:29709 stop:29942 length:234 start_codon:yes stop_codon:yes gene_type:complete